MTTPTTPAGWYPDPDGSGGQRYWDGFGWTEHRSPAVAAPEPAGESSMSEQPTSVVSLPDQPTSVVPSGAHRVPDQEPEPEVPATVVTPSFETPSFETPKHERPSFGPPSYEPPTFETPSFEATAAEATASAHPSSEAPSPEAPSYETPSYEPPPLETPSYEPPSFQTPSYGAPSFGSPSSEAPSFHTPSYATPSFGEPSTFAGSDGMGGPPNDNRKLLTAYLSGVGVLLLALILAAVYGFVIRDNTPPEVTSSGTSTSSTTSSESSTTETESETATATPTPGFGDEATEGDFVFSVASTDSGDTVTSPINEYIEKTATGQFIVVYLNVGNTGTAPLTFLSTLQVLNTDTGTFTPDDEASFYLGGGVVTINPGEQVETAIAFDVPVDAAPVSILIHGEPGGAGVDLPL